jgi:sodium-dependent phosphate cotransporter
MFNWLTVIVLLPIEITTRYLETLTDSIMNMFDWKQDKSTKTEFLNKLTKPFTQLVIEVRDI